MPKLPVVKARELIRALQQQGFVILVQVGSHVQLKHPDGRRTTIPFHAGKDIKPGTLLNILRQINMSKVDLQRIL
ncbi:MAG: type II toxin-antitoxin system HicA family toxin [Candidatus Kerfeldbacteria bacterium]|nr:type II toxin-antitoxin system HicA family toxin [Candidatus Kerfeldbacteria bacterium]